MSDMTDAAKLRLLVEWFDVDDKRRGRAAHHRQVQEDLTAIADRLDAFRWRDDPPDRPGSYVVPVCEDCDGEPVLVIIQFKKQAGGLVDEEGHPPGHSFKGPWYGPLPKVQR